MSNITDEEIEKLEKLIKGLKGFLVNHDDLITIEKLITHHNATKDRQNHKDLEIERLHNVRRTLERGLRLAEHTPIDRNYVDVFIHAIDELKASGLQSPPQTSEPDEQSEEG